MKVTQTNIDVRYAETDQMGVVHHSNYVVWCELGRTKLINELGFDYAELESSGILSPVININLDYKQPAHFGETVTISTWIESYDGIRVIYGYHTENEKGTTCMEGTSTHVCVNKETFRPISIKKHLPDWHKTYEKHKK
ncbi:acyl-CoA thioester hydrolase [Alteribacillus persepolensis]|uniref:Acyl-CoA thioester hydrolase n=1 Tax=Alteribacillus persepolensis TaxID=568899 RepID=A0A1G7YYZ0_9BACI|nr:thioesterase family protein [Alteribacillus persepolensis]SDH01673.1 acyl-CoA thioester hydrolase [Alteribacillus persepolensis]